MFPDDLPTPANLPKGLLSASAATYPVENADVIASDFLQRRGEYTLNTLQRVVQSDEYERRHDRILALFALGYLPDPEAIDILLPFLHSKEHSERWVSALSLGRHKNEEVFSLLQDLLLDELQNVRFEKNLRRYDDADWYVMRCLDIIFILGDWGNTVAVPNLRKAFRFCLEREVEMQADSSSLTLIDLWWHPLQKSIAYALGQLGAWGVFSTIQMSLPQWNIASLYLILGSLQSAPNTELFEQRFALIQELSHPFIKRRDGTLTAPFVGLDQLGRVLQERFGFSSEEQISYFQQIWEANPRYDFIHPFPT